ncbi:VOC family protein [Flaviaesturariibacter flavus]|uniref:VOC family protein n=1 Tax=Flaviaesturariibacter flavus TaxID=2502780 RepID=A0A4R1B9H7_9BACT|nr:VOC family protein [Flaviaesturariibacter flavus]TCJ13559.1 VOC family protein [Flaviaesturariibacter flavus]
MQKITPFLWFDGNALEAARFYTGIFPDARITSDLPGPGGKPMVVAFELAGQSFTALNGGPQFTFNESVSFVIDCKDQGEIDHYWDRLTAEGGTPSRCGWLKDPFGLSWQVVPSRLPQLIRHPAAMQAMMGMSKIVLADLEAAAATS